MIQGQLFIYLVETGQLCYKIPLKPETNVKDVTNIVSVTQKPYFAALLEGDRQEKIVLTTTFNFLYFQKRANLYDVKNKKWVRTIPSWTGMTSSNGRWGLSAPSKGGEQLSEYHS